MALNPLDRLVRDMEDVKRQLAGRSQLNHSSLENTAIPVYDEDGTERLRIGAQDDGTHAVVYVQGPPPPRPTAPVVSVDGPVVRVRWDGELMGGHIPEDFSRIDVHFALASDDIDDASAVRGNLATSAGNETVLAATQTGTYRVGLVAVSQSRARSEMSETVDVDVTLVDIEGALDAVVENARGGSNYYTPTPPPGSDHDPDRDLWFDTSVGEDGLTHYTPHRWDGERWVSLEDERVAALQDAQAALRDDVENIIVDANGNATFWLPYEPDETTDPTPKRGDLWFDTSEGGGNKLHRFDGQVWVSASDGRFNTIQDAQEALEADVDRVRTSVDGKNAVTQSTSTPPNQYDGALGDIWERMSSMGSGGRSVSRWRWNGDVWVSNLIGDTVLGNVDAAKIGTGYLDAERLRAGSIAASSIAVGDFSNLATVDPVRNVNVTRPPNWSTVTDGDYTKPAAGSENYLMFKDRTDTVPFSAGEELRIEFRGKTVGGTTTGSIWLWGYPQSQSGNASGSEVITGSTLTFTPTEQAFSTSLKIPESFGTSQNLTSWITGLRGAGAWNGDAIHAVRVRNVRVYRMSGAALIQDGAITTDKIRAGAITSDSGIFGTVDAGILNAGEIAAARIGADTITADKLLVGVATNLLPGADTIAASNAGWSAFGRNTSDPSVWLRGQTTAETDAPFMLRAGEAYKATVDVRASVAGARFFWQLIHATDRNGPYVFSSVPVATGYLSFEAEFEVPVSGNYVLRVYGNHSAGVPNSGYMWFRAPRIAPMTGATLIEDGAITTDKIEAGAITTDSAIFGTVDAGILTAGEIDAARIGAGTIDTPHLAFGAATGDVLSVDALNFKTAIGLDIRSSAFRAGDAVEITEDFGIRQFGPDGALNVSLPSDGSEAQFRGDLSARTLTATGRMAIQGPGAIASGGVLELESGVTPPISPPQVSQWWASTSMPSLAEGESVSGLVWADGHWWRGVQVTGANSSNSVRARVEKITAAGVLVSSFPTAFGIRINGITYLNGLLYVLGAVVGGAVSNRFVIAYTLTGTEQYRWEYNAYGTGTYQPGIGVIGQNIAIAQCWASGELSWRIYRPTDGYQISRIDRDSRVASDIVSINLAAYDLGTPRIVLGVSRQTNASMQVLVYTNSITNPVWVSEESWYAADYAAIRGLAWDGSLFHTLQPNGDLAQYEPNEAGRFLGDNEADWRIAIGWASNDGSRATPAGPPSAPFRFLRRSRHTKTINDVPEGVERARFYYAKTAGEVSRTDLHSVSFIGADARLAWSGSLPGDWATRSNPPAVNSFVADKPGEIRSSIGNFRVDGSGAGQWGPLTFGADGSMTGPWAAGTVMIPAVANTPTRVTVTFPAGRFEQFPMVLVTPFSGVPGTTVLGASVGALSESSVDLVLTRTNTVDTQVYWIAMERTQ